MQRLLEDRIAIVTGAAQGIGRALSLGLAQHGAHVALLDVQAARDGAEQVEALDRRACAFACDVTDGDACQRAVEAVSQQLGPVSILVNNAGVLLRGRVDDPDALEKLQQTMDVNLAGMVRMTRACLPALRATRGAVINVASIQSFAALQNSFAYNASKGAVLQLTKALASELAPDGIRVNAIAPGAIATPLNAETRARPGYLDDFLKRVPLKRVGEPEDLVGAAVFLASTLSAYVTGATIPVDGGFLAI